MDKLLCSKLPGEHLALLLRALPKPSLVAKIFGLTRFPCKQQPCSKRLGEHLAFTNGAAKA